MRGLAAAVVSTLILAGSASAGEHDLRAGLAYSGHLLFTDVAAASIEWRAVHRPHHAFLRELDLESGLALSFDAKFYEIPLLARFELYHFWKLGLELSGFVVSYFEGTGALTPVLCAGVPFTDGRLRVQPELCFNASAGPPGGPSYMGGLWTGLGLGAMYAF